MMLNKTICIIDDDRSYRYLAKHLIEESAVPIGHILEFDSAELAIEVLKYSTERTDALPDIILLDLNMPKMNGWEFVEAYENLSNNDRQNTRLYIVSTSDNPDDIKRSQSYTSIQGYIRKPFSIDEFLALCNN